LKRREADRTRIARDLHDDIGQRLVLLAVEIGQLSNTSLNRNEFRARIAVVREQVSDISSSVHGLSHQLHSSSLKHLGLAAAARSYCRQISAQQGVEMDFKSDNIPADLPPDVSLCLFRVLQEALQNVVKHSGANTFNVKLRGDSHSICLAVSDLGAGFQVENAMAGPGLGLISMRERLKLVKGELSIRPQKHGTTIVACVPLPSGFVTASAAI
jgi:signal transduction histidine kinase